MVDFSYRPLFMMLSVDKLITVFCALCCEFPVCVVSENISLLTPVCEALLSFLFPFTWQGAYIPVLPDHMTEILDAPVPYLIGIQRDYFDDNNMSQARNRPAMASTCALSFVSGCMLHIFTYIGCLCGLGQ